MMNTIYLMNILYTVEKRPGDLNIAMENGLFIDDFPS